MKKPVVLCIMDGFGKNPSDYGNLCNPKIKDVEIMQFLPQEPQTLIN